MYRPTRVKPYRDKNLRNQALTCNFKQRVTQAAIGKSFEAETPSPSAIQPQPPG